MLDWMERLFLLGVIVLPGLGPVATVIAWRLRQRVSALEARLTTLEAHAPQAAGTTTADTEPAPAPRIRRGTPRCTVRFTPTVGRPRPPVAGLCLTGAAVAAGGASGSMLHGGYCWAWPLLWAAGCS
ncbi:hypothetical protein [Thioalkalivibrio sp. ALJ24]|uniref:hypothetical protein n=1 Tax=Thioalkalivibrio sp. ALJ24 TaxID=545276 RepID=UPI0003673D3E|nr:hypothetical protein [Thioalkalivibrio sp. ALJ24]